MGIIYKATNKINGKIYIGQTTKSLKNRIGYHWRTKDCMLFSRAFRKYGKENFEWEIIKEAKNEELNDWERFYIKKYDSRNQSIGYNLAEGGHSCPLSVESRIKISETKIGKREFYGIKDGEVIKFNNIVEASIYMQCRTSNISRVLNGERNMYNGWHFTFDENMKNKKEFYGKNLDNKQLFTFVSKVEASKVSGINRRTIENMLRKNKFIYNHWCFAYDKDKVISSDSPEFIYGKKDGIIRTFEKNQSIIAEEIKCKSSNVSSCLKGKIKTVKGWRFSYDLRSLLVDKSAFSLYNKDKDTTKIFYNTREASEFLRCSISSIQKLIKGKLKIVKGYIVI